MAKKAQSLVRTRKLEASCGCGISYVGNQWTQLSGTQFDKITTRYEVLSPPSVYFNREFPYIFVAKASFSAYVSGKNVLKIGEKCNFSTKTSTTDFGRAFCSIPFPFFASEWLKYAVFAF